MGGWEVRFLQIPQGCLFTLVRLCFCKSLSASTPFPLPPATDTRMVSTQGVLQPRSRCRGHIWRIGLDSGWMCADLPRPCSSADLAFLKILSASKQYLAHEMMSLFVKQSIVWAMLHALVLLPCFALLCSWLAKHVLCLRS